MKKFLLLCMALSIFFIESFAQVNEPENTVTVEDGSIVLVKITDTLIVSCPANYIDGGCHDSVEYDRTLLTLIGKRHSDTPGYEKQVAPEDWDSSDWGNTLWYFLPKNPGQGS